MGREDARARLGPMALGLAGAGLIALSAMRVGEVPHAARALWLASLLCFALNVGLLSYIYKMERR